ncbi:aminotransferase class I/II-fold pyridoxal phosphate-dependent enzyme [Klebsiella pneumoniae]|uniref:pyridoxal phosphate-dependent aminotransferase n=1 Tax=Klebsiella pneumoniae TaxID=573 RepID=UPI002DB5D17B|nr:aminotransferase class I/II-fold pyridoxal phosphate-dependent enzyme [Klebsiella pneumoniae]MEC4370760.1 aminotransferase class I/II-fold pyridoxal phosphate-dependent enzyme [Klebsiella pneumoniae]MEC4428728.1 aminotransferase class I/II-fold pyridoxal phosphate-dependent enzyme [Klebsiella pneumoniae]MEC4439262.1 aminotransferase class I/II-fold pyridoxal phosphate-dependent enzyme [Klebsiella pneumoniae]HDO6756156.1 aminotransferase class I/II-fold pyridoxal phosphate-dependent enzyme [K
MFNSSRAINHNDELNTYRTMFSWVPVFKKKWNTDDIIDLAYGGAFFSPPEVLTDLLQSSDFRTEWHDYYLGDHEDFIQSAKNYLNKIYSTTVYNHLDIMSCLGAKNGLLLTARTFLDQNDKMLSTVPGYPVLQAYAASLGTKVIHLPLQEEKKFQPDLSILSEEVLSQIKLISINYPNNPTGAVLKPQYLKNIISICKEYNILLINDCAYTAINRYPSMRLSVFSEKYAEDVALEIHTLSKSFQIPGWRVGFIAGNNDLLDKIRVTRSMMESGQARFLYRSVLPALNSPEFYLERLNSHIERRIKLVSDVFSHAGFIVTPSAGTFFILVSHPEVDDCISFAKELASETGIFILPLGEGYKKLRVSMTWKFRSEEHDLSVAKELSGRLLKHMQKGEYSK